MLEVQHSLSIFACLGLRFLGRLDRLCEDCPLVRLIRKLWALPVSGSIKPSRPQTL